MRTSLHSHCLLAVILLAAPAAQAEIKLGFVDLQRALAEVGEGREAKGRLKLEQDRNRAELESEKAKLGADKAVLDKQASMMSEEVRAKKFAEWQQRMLETVQRAEKKQQDLVEKERVELKKIFDRMDPIISGIAQRDGLAMVFEKTDSGLVYAPASMDLTAELVRTYNEKHPAKDKAPAASRGASK
jgi:outer membrane protein